MKVEMRCAVLGILLLSFAGTSLLPITDPVESNYALTAKEMLLSGDFISPRIYGNFWYDKPIFFYWELIAAFSVFGVNEFAARFFPAVFSLLNVGAVYFFAKRLYDARVAFFSALIFATTMSYFYLSRAVITDMAFVFFFNAVLISFYMAYSTRRRRLYLLSFFFAGLAVLTKGPIGILLPGLILLCFLLVRKRPGELLRMMWIPGLLIFAAVGGYWYYRMYLLHGSDFITNFFGVHNVLRATVSEHPRDDVFYYYAVIFLLGFFPWSFLLLYQLKRKWRELRAAKWREDVIFLLLWAGVVHVVFQCMATKYVTYTQPAFLPLAILAGCLLKDSGRLVKRLAAGLIVFYIAMTYLAAVPLAEQASGLETAEALRAVNADGEIPVVYFSDYSASAVFYYGRNIARMQTRAGVESSKPNGISWNAKNVMPQLASEDLPRGKPVYVVLKKSKLEELKSLLPNAELSVVRDMDQRLLLEAVLPDSASQDAGKRTGQSSASFVGTFRSSEERRERIA